MSQHRQRLQALLRELFQFDSADLDFGFYAVMNRRRDRIEHFIEHDLLDAVEEGAGILEAGAVEEAQQRLADARKAVVNAFGDDAFDPANWETFKRLPAGQRYAAAEAAAADAAASADLKMGVYNDLYQFFARYYQDGDFIAQRRYGRHNKYAVPYNGEEVTLYWANFDQYYVKSAAHFTNYRFTLPATVDLPGGADVQVRITKVDVERDNLKGDKRFFLLAPGQPVAWDAAQQTLTVPVEYRPLTEEETRRLGPRNQQERLLEEAHAAVLAAVENRSLAALLAAPDPQRPNQPSRLAYHLNRYAAENTRDFFVHKDLGGFLRRELDFYLKSEIVNLDDIDLRDGDSLRRAGARAQTVRQIAHKIIDFLDQLERFQRRLFLKRKFVLQSDYCLTLDKLPEAARAGFYPAVLANTRQLAEWQALYGLSVATEDDLAQHPHVMLDTAFFDAPFKYRLLAALGNLDEALDGLLVHGDNFQALSLLRSTFSAQISCIHIDPPYNTATSGFLYKNDYQHSSWLAMMENRISAGLALLSSDGSFLCHIDENEYERLQLLFDNFSVANGGTLIWDKRNPMNAGRGIATQHEYVIWRTNLQSPIYLENDNANSILAKAEEIVVKHGANLDAAQREFADWINNNPKLSGGEKAYRYLDEKGQVYQSVSLRAPEPRLDPKFHSPLIHPITNKPCPVPPNGFSRTPETLQAMIERGEIIFGPTEDIQPRQKKLLTGESKRQIPSVLQEGRKGKADLQKMGLDFPYCHPVALYTELIGAALTSSTQTVLDFFAGSGTTAHAVMDLNATDQGRRKYILVEMGDYFDTVLKPRIQKVAYAGEWKDGKPVTPEDGQGQILPTGQPHMFQYIRLESYDDTFHNIRLRDPDGDQLRLLDSLPDYFLSYLLDHETAGSPTLLDIASFERPFDYQLHVTGRGGVLAPQPVDLVATFNFLLGLAVESIQTFAWEDGVESGGRRYVRVLGSDPKGKRVCVLWRNAPPPDQLEAERAWAAEHLLAGVEYDKLYVNGESLLAAALALEPEFKRLLEEGVH